MNIAEILSIYDEFLKSFTPLLEVGDEESHQKALDAIGQLLEFSSRDDELNPYSALICLLANAIDKYESLDSDLNHFINKSEAIPAGIAMLVTLIDQHGLSSSDLPEIGDCSIVSQVLSGEKSLSRSAIDGIALRFGIPYGRFF
jgi:HTH-type transcriptional regulator/antitoxin HigA